MTTWRRQLKLLKHLIQYQEETSSRGPSVAELSILGDDRLPATLSRLRARGFIEYSAPLSSQSIIRTTAKGQCYFDVRREEIQNFIMKSILIPVLVSLITYFITSYAFPVKETSAPSSPVLCTCTPPESTPPA